ncbi:MAG: hypothetical protein ACOYL3_15715 [Desulfuromonadaceae bacterium]
MSVHQRQKLDVTIMMDFSSCNYDCYYCCAAGVSKKGLRLADLSVHYLKFIDDFDAPAKTVRLNSYGEVTLMDGFWPFLGEVALRAQVSIATNLSFDPELLYRSAPPDAILFLLTTLHPQTELCLEQFIGKCREMGRRGYQILVHYIVDDDRVHEAGIHQHRMAEEGIRFFVSPMQGVVRGKKLPEQLVSATKGYLTRTIEELHPQLLVRYPELAFTGLDCGAGYDMFCIRGRAVTPCMNSERLLGWVDGAYEPFPRSLPCKASHAQSQCLPDLFLNSCRSYCMGDHELACSRAALEVALVEFDRLHRTTVQPARILLGPAWIKGFRQRLASIPSKCCLASFGVPFYPYLDLIGEFTTIGEFVSSQKGVEPWRGLPSVYSEDYAQRATSSDPLIVLSSVYQANEAREFIERLSAGKKPLVAILDVPVSLGNQRRFYEVAPCQVDVTMSS